VETFIALTDNNTLLSFNRSNTTQVRSTTVTGVEGALLGIDRRPADGSIYALSTANHIYRIDPNTVGSSTTEATRISTLSRPFEAGIVSGFDFNPVPDRLRLVGDNDQNFRINVDTGEVILDGMLAFEGSDPNAGVNPNITAAAYTNSFDGTSSTQLYNIDPLLDTLILQSPPNDGTQVTVGNLGVDFDPVGGFDILSVSEGDNRAFAVSNATLYSVNLETGAVTGLGEIGSDRTVNLLGFTVFSTDTLNPMNMGGGAFNSLQYLASHRDLITEFGFDLGAADQHYTQFGIAENRALDTFDELSYLASWGDLIQTFGSNTELATEHYIRFGAAEGRGTDLFDAASYLNRHPDLQAAFGSDRMAATRHYVEFGFEEGRMI
jgi:hypothetical protein